MFLHRLGRVDNNDILQVVLQIFGAERQNQVAYRCVDAADHDVILQLGEFAFVGSFHLRDRFRVAEIQLALLASLRLALRQHAPVHQATLGVSQLCRFLNVLLAWVEVADVANVHLVEGLAAPVRPPILATQELGELPRPL